VRPGEAYTLGHDAAASGFFFDAMELVAVVSTHVGGLDALRGAIELIFAERDATHERMARTVALCSGAFRRPFHAPTEVDAYRALLTDGVFEIVNRWSIIQDIKTVNQLQAWFYAGFGLGRAATIVRGVQLFERVHAVAPNEPNLAQMPIRLRRLAQEATRQVEVAGGEDDLDRVRPLFVDVASRLRRLLMVLNRDPDEIAFSALEADDLRAFDDVARRVLLDFAQGRPGR